MGAHSLTNEVLRPIRAVAKADHLTLVIGAGASVPSGLPTWTQLVERLLVRSFPGPDSVVMADRIIRTQGLSLAAGAAIGSASDRVKARRVASALYGTDRKGLVPSEMHRAVAELVAHRAQTKADTKLLTTNYDDLVEAALSETDQGFRRRHASAKPGGKGVMVEHLNGLLGQDGTDSETLLLTSVDYAREIAPQAAYNWRVHTFGEGAQDGPILFVGTSLTDPLLMQYLSQIEDSGEGRFVAFARQSFDLPEGLEARFEKALIKQWEQFGVQPVFGDDYADMALLIRELTAIGEPGYRAPYKRLQNAWTSFRSDFLARQREAEEKLSEDVGSLASQLGDEANLILWLADGDGHLVRFAGSHRTYTNEKHLRRIPYAHSTRWVITRALADGTDSMRVSTLEPEHGSRGTPSRRWHTVAAIAIAATVDGAPPITVGGLSAATTRAVPDVDHAALDTALRKSAMKWRGRLEGWID